MEIIKPKICLTEDEADDIRSLLFKMADIGSTSYYANPKDVEMAEHYADRLNDCLMQI